MKRLVYSGDNWLECLRLTDKQLLRFCRTDVFKTTGKGGQKKNKTSNAIRLTFFHLVVTASQSRSKAININQALKKLRLAIAMDVKRSTLKIADLQPAPPEIERYLNTSEIGISQSNPLFPVFIGYIVDCYLKHQGNCGDMAQDLGFTSSQLRKFVEGKGKLKELFRQVKSNWQSISDRA